MAQTRHELFTTTKSIYHTKLAEHHAEAVVVVAIVGAIVVPIRNATVPCVVVPTATTKHAV